MGDIEAEKYAEVAIIDKFNQIHKHFDHLQLKELSLCYAFNHYELFLNPLQISIK